MRQEIKPAVHGDSSTYNGYLFFFYFFAGTVASIRDDVIQSKGYKLWFDAKPHFLKNYVLSMISDSYTNKTELIIPNRD
ncbi:MAG TPA: hypothetical protein VEF53_16060 [Patescibacteria group bacterium]|nr:hypothetical protein [Patescibacteria group bacterium]